MEDVFRSKWFRHSCFRFRFTWDRLTVIKTAGIASFDALLPQPLRLLLVRGWRSFAVAVVVAVVSVDFAEEVARWLGQ